MGGQCERCGTAVEQRLLSQWFFRITDYAQRLLDNLDWIDWSDITLTAQRNWIGRSEGATALPGSDAGGADPDETIEVFTTRPDTIFGATYMVLAPEHPLVDVVTTDERRAEVVGLPRRRAPQKDLVERRKTDDKTKTGVFTGGFASTRPPVEPIPVWIADYVLMEYGTGAIMAVPGHDQRDFEFATAVRAADRPRRGRPGAGATAADPPPCRWSSATRRSSSCRGRRWSTAASSTA